MAISNLGKSFSKSIDEETERKPLTVLDLFEIMKLTAAATDRLFGRKSYNVLPKMLLVSWTGHREELSGRLALRERKKDS